MKRFVVSLVCLMGSLTLAGEGGAVSRIIQGVATVTDGDTIEVHGTSIRLNGIDAPESNQTCLDNHGKALRCGQAAALALADKIGRSPVQCEQRDTDRYGRVIADCFQSGERLNKWLVRSGLAVAYRKYSMEYVADEDAARADGAGIWGTEFVMPWDWRKGSRQSGDLNAAQRLLLLAQRSYSCSPRRTCSAIQSCDEAYWYLENCSWGGRLDRDGDGVPCESIC